MRIKFFLTLFLFTLYQLVLSYLLRPFLGSQQLDSVSLAHLLSYYKMYFDIICIVALIYFAIPLFKEKKRGIAIVAICLSLFFFIFLNFIFVAANIFHQPKNLLFADVNKNKVDKNEMIVGIEFHGKSKAYPVPFIDYHHQIIDSLDGQKYIATYCGLCRTGRFFLPYINGKYTTFRLVGINHNNAMLEDDLTKSWWSQESGTCIAGQLKGTMLEEMTVHNMTLQKWIELYPNTEIMQPDPAYAHRYPYHDYYGENIENPNMPSSGGTWSAHSFVIGISKGGVSKAIEWNNLLKNKIIKDNIAGIPYILALANDNKSFVAFENNLEANIELRNDTLFFNNVPHNFAGINLLTGKKELLSIKAYREFWFSWKNAHPNTIQYQPK